MYLRYGDLSWDALEGPEGGGDAPNPEAGKPDAGRPRLSAPKANDHLPVVRLHGVELHAITEAGCIKHILDELDAGHGGVVVTPNLDHLRRCVRDMRFGALVAEADLVVADGMPLVWASRLQGTPLPERVAGSDLVSSLSAAAAERGRTIFMLGGKPGTAEGAAAVLRERHPNIKIAGWHCPPVGFESDEPALQEIIEKLSSTRPEIVYVALGSPKQERLIERVRRILPNAWWLGVGNSFSFLCGDVRRAPLWMQKRGLEWIHRLLQEPKRLFKRYIVVGLPFAASLMGRAVLKGRLAKLRGGEAETAKRRDGETAKEGEMKTVKELAGPAERRSTRRMNLSAADVLPSASAERTLGRLRALVLLGGSVRPTPLTQSIGRSMLDLPLDDHGTILNHWQYHAAELARLAGLGTLPLRVLVDKHSPAPTTPAPREGVQLTIERDLSEYRGTGGVLGDLAKDYSDDDLILVANAAQVLLDPLSVLAAALDRTDGEISLVSHQDGTPSGLMLVSCAALRLIPHSGFVDMKEQALPAIAKRYDVGVLHRRRLTGLPVRSLADYIMALRHYHRRRSGKPAVNDPLAEDWRPTFAIVEEGAVIDASARVHDSVVLRGGHVEAGAVLVRSIVCPGGTVRKDRAAVDQFVTALEPQHRMPGEKAGKSRREGAAVLENRA